MNDLNEIYDRINWAVNEIGKLNLELADWSQQSVVLSSCPDAEQPMLIQLNALQTQPIPFSCRARSGTIVNELRSCLDGLTSTLAVRNGKSASRVYFPVTKLEADFDTDPRLMGKIKKLAAADQAAIISTRPFSLSKSGDPGNQLLYGLHQADIKRKHHALVANNSGSSVGLRNGWTGVFFGAPKTLTDQPQTMAWISDDSIAEITFTPTFDYAEPDVLRGRGVVQSLYEFANAVRSIVTIFR